jgi:uncharacterized protein (DUF2164 family)
MAKAKFKIDKIIEQVQNIKDYLEERIKENEEEVKQFEDEFYKITAKEYSSKWYNFTIDEKEAKKIVQGDPFTATNQWEIRYCSQIRKIREKIGGYCDLKHSMARLITMFKFCISLNIDDIELDSSEVLAIKKGLNIINKEEKL